MVEHGASPQEATHTAVLPRGFSDDLRFTVAEFEPPDLRMPERTQFGMTARCAA